MDTNKKEEIIEGVIEANTRIIIERTPIGTPFEAMELTYNPKQFLDKLDKEKKNKENELTEEDD